MSLFDGPWSKLYRKQRWRNRSELQRKMFPLCQMCLQKNMVFAAEIADHVVPHHGDQNLFWFGELQSLCLSCHSSSKLQLENKGYINDIGEDGFPTDAAHPFNVNSKG